MTINVTNQAPSPSSPLGTGAAVTFDVTFDPASDEEAVIVSFNFGTSSETVWAGSGFLAPYAGSSQRAAIAGGYAFTVRRSGNWPSSPAISVSEVSGGGPLEVDFELPLVLAGNRVTRPTGNGLETLYLAIAPGDVHVENAALLVLVAAGEFGAVVAAPDLNLPAAELAEFDAAEDCLISILCCYVADAPQFVTSLRNLGVRDTALPTIVSKTVATGSNPNALVVVYSEAVWHEDLTGFALSAFSVGTSRTITAIESGNGTTTVTFTLSGNCSAGDACNLVIGSTRTLADLNGNLIAAGSSAVTFT